MKMHNFIGLCLFVYLCNRHTALSTTIDQYTNLSTVNLTTLTDNSLFTRWRPVYHFASPNSWMNDPCGPLYNPTTKNYHLYYQVQPGYVEWGNISWGHAKSKDMIFWTDVTSWEGYDYVALAPGIGNNQSSRGVFTGSTLPISPDGNTTNGAITVIYTSVKYLPLTVNNSYVFGSETQSLAVSYDDGVTFQHYEKSPILPSSPQGLDVTGWRDPKFEKWSRMDMFLYGTDIGNYYMTISSGIKNNGSRLFLYQAPANDVTNWTYLGILISTPANYSFNQEWCGSFGYDFEVSNTFSLLEKDVDGGDHQTYHNFASLGTERDNTTLHASIHWSLWMEGNFTKTNDNNVIMNIISAGVSDWGDAYAFNSFYDPIGDRRIFYGWVLEIHNNYGERAFGYNGQLTLPREVFVQVYQNVTNVSQAFLQQGPWITSLNTDGTYTFKTLGVRPIDEVVNLRQTDRLANFISQTFNQTTNFTRLNISTMNFELQVTINITGLNTTGGIVFRRSSNGLEYTTLYYNPTTEYLILNRTYSSLITEFTHTSIYAKHTLLTTMTNTNTPQKELLSLRIFVDNSLVEIYANNRTAISTHVYPSLSTANDLGYFVDVSGQGGSVIFSNISIWSNLKNAFPLRPTNSSIKLIVDSTTTNVSYNLHANAVYLFFFIIILFSNCFL